jgi:Putative DNA-binding domain
VNGHPSIPTPASVQQLIAQGEGPRLELKESTPSVLALGQLISALANADGGTILVGVREPNVIVGCNFHNLSQVFDRASANLRPTPASYLHQVTVNGRDVGVIQVPRSPQLVVSAAGAYIREGAASRALAPAEIQAKLGQAGAPNQDVIATAIAAITETVSALRQDLKRSQSIKGQLPSILIGFLLGILASVIASFIFEAIRNTGGNAGVRPAASVDNSEPLSIKALTSSPATGFSWWPCGARATIDSSPTSSGPARRLQGGEPEGVSRAQEPNARSVPMGGSSIR